MVKSCPIFDQAAKLGKASRDAYNPGLLLILYDLLKIGLPKVSLPTLMTLAVIMNQTISRLTFNPVILSHEDCYHLDPPCCFGLCWGYP